MKKLNYITILGLATGLAFAWNAAAEDETGIVNYRDDSNGANAAWQLGRPGTAYENIHEVPNGHPGSNGGSMFKALCDNAVLSFTVAQNTTANGFIFGTYTYEFDAKGNLVYEVDENAYVYKKDDQGNYIQENGKPVIDTDAIVKKPKVNFTQLGTVEKGETQITIEKTTEAGTETVKVDSISSDTFSSKDLVGIWVAEKGTTPGAFGTTLYSAMVSNPDYPEGGQWYTEADMVTWGPYFPEYEGSAYVEFHFTGKRPTEGTDNVILLVQGASASGGPLPGVWATIALAGAASAYLKRRRKENK